MSSIGTFGLVWTYVSEADFVSGLRVLNKTFPRLNDLITSFTGEVRGAGKSLLVGAYPTFFMPYSGSSKTRLSRAGIGVGRLVTLPL
jgi:hypothetical protein